MTKKVITVCDVCEDPNRSTVAYRITSGDRKASVDLCDEHGKPVESLLMPAVAAVQPTRRRRSLGARVTTIEEIEKTAKAPARKRAAKKTAAKA